MLNIVSNFLRDRSEKHLGPGTPLGLGESDMYAPADATREKNGLVPPLLIALILGLLFLSRLGR
jgi:hypothetical protein